MALDNCGGHTHNPDTNNYGYHYHAQVISQTVTVAAQGLTVGQTYSAFIPGPYKCNILNKYNLNIMYSHK